MREVEELPNLRELQIDAQGATLSTAVYENLRAVIFDGVLVPGLKLEEEALSRALGVSRTPLRQALQRLEHDGLVEIIPWRGAFVADLTKQEIIDLLELREGLEGIAARLATERIDRLTLRRMRELMDPDRLTAAVDSDPRLIAKSDTLFHEMIYKATGNKKLIEVMRRINDQSHLMRLKTVHLIERRGVSLEETWRVLRAIEEGDEDQAEFYARQHIQTLRAVVVSSFPDGATLSKIDIKKRKD